MDGGALMMVVVTLVVFASLAFLLFATGRSIRDQRTEGRSVWREFGLGLCLMILFFVTWIGHGISEWQVYTDEQLQHGQPVETGDFFAEFSQSTLENWQSEFLQLFSFVTLAAILIHKGSAESKDGEEKMEASLRRIEQRLGTLPDTASDKPGESWQLPETPLEANDPSPIRRQTVSSRSPK